jgi:hypothetical protein
MVNDSSAQTLQNRAYANDPDGDIVHLHARRPGEIVEGTTIRVRLLDRLSTVDSERGEAFRTKVASDVLQDGRVLIPAGAEIDGRVTQVSSGHVGGHGTMHLNPEVVILPDGTRYRLHAEISGTPGSRTRVGGEGGINPGSRVRKDEIEYGGAVGAGVVTGAIRRWAGGRCYRRIDRCGSYYSPPDGEPSAGYAGRGSSASVHADRAAGPGSGGECGSGGDERKLACG